MSASNDTKAAKKILVVDDEEAMREVLQVRLTGWGYEVAVASDGAEGRRLFERFEPDLVLTDVVLPDTEGTELLPAFLEQDPDLPVILMTAYGSVEKAVEAMKEGARDFLTKPIDYGNLKAVIDDAERTTGIRRTTRQLDSALQKEDLSVGEMIGEGDAMERIFEQIRQVAGTDAPVFITGESGTGKELAARAIHRLSRRSDGPFVPVNTAAIPSELMESEIFGHEKGAFTGAIDSRPGCFEMAHGGTLFLDEIAEMPLPLQPKLLRVLEDGRVRRLGGKQERQLDVRLIAATNREPREAIAEKLLREDLFYRLNVFQLELPPLRARSDLPLLAQHLLTRLNERHGTNVEGLGEEAARTLATYPWPGNVRELRNILERAVVLAKEGWIEPVHLPPYVRNPEVATTVVGDRLVLPLDTTVAEAEKRLILETLERTDQNKAETARRLGIDVKTVRNKLKSYGMM
jgi:DNA-binding NtrC family response regulator